MVCLSNLTFSQTKNNNDLVGTKWRTTLNDGTVNGTLRFIDNSTVMYGYFPLSNSGEPSDLKEIRSSYSYDNNTHTGRIEYENSTFTIKGDYLSFKPAGYYNGIIYQKVVPK